MQRIPTSVHGVIDYVTGAALLAAPVLFRLKDQPASAAAARVAGANVLATSSVTDYEASVANVVPMRTHLALDAASGAALAASPFVLGYSKGGTRYWLPHVVVGLQEIAVAALTKPERLSKRSRAAGTLKGLVDRVRG